MKKDMMALQSKIENYKIFSSDDCAIDDPELLTTKKHLMSEYTPNKLLHAIYYKKRENVLSKTYSETELWHDDPLNKNKLIIRCEYSMTFSDANEPIIVKAEGYDKKYVKQRASQIFLSKVFPPGTSWKQMI